MKTTLLVASTLAAAFASEATSTTQSLQLTTTANPNVTMHYYTTRESNGDYWFHGQIDYFNVTSTSWTASSYHGVYATVMMGGKTDGVNCQMTSFIDATKDILGCWDARVVSNALSNDTWTTADQNVVNGTHSSSYTTVGTVKYANATFKFSRKFNTTDVNDVEITDGQSLTLYAATGLHTKYVYNPTFAAAYTGLTTAYTVQLESVASGAISMISNLMIVVVLCLSLQF